MMMPTRWSIAVVLGVVAMAPVNAPSSGGEPAAVDEKSMEAWWVDLEKGDTVATRALLNLADRPKDTVAFLKKKMKPLTISSGQVKALLLKLGNGNETVWKPAFEELEYFDPRLAIDLKTLMDRYTEAPTRQRMVEVMSGREAESLKGKEIELWNVGQGDGFNFFAKPNFGSWWAEHRIERINSDSWRNTKKKWTRAVRAIVLLEHIGSPDAEAILKEMATGHPDAHPTKVAREALKTLAAR
ncbi:MAG: hypothetical protein ACLQGP_36260 [Isosphaeraceae bacterium]